MVKAAVRFALAWSCTPCRAALGVPGGQEYKPGRWALGAMHDSHLADLVLAGWEVSYPDGPDEAADVCCEHYWALCDADPDA
jgi:hypothetical protein